MKRKKGGDKEAKERLKQEEILAKENKKSLMKLGKDKRKSEAIDRNKVRAVYRKDFGGELKKIRSEACASVLQYFDEEEVFQEQTEHSRTYSQRSMREQSTVVDPKISRAHLEALLNSALTCDEAFLSGLSNGVMHQPQVTIVSGVDSDGDDILGGGTRQTQQLQLKGSSISAVELYKARDKEEDKENGEKEKEGEKEGEGEGGIGIDPVRWDDVFQVVNCLNVFSTHLELQMPLMLTDVVDKMVKITLAGDAFKNDVLSSSQIPEIGSKSVHVRTASGGGNGEGSVGVSGGLNGVGEGVDGVTVGDGVGVCVMREVRESHDSAVESSSDAMDIVTDEVTSNHTEEIEENKVEIEVEKEIGTNAHSDDVTDNGAFSRPNSDDHESHSNRQSEHEVKTEINGLDGNSDSLVIHGEVKQEHENKNRNEEENGIAVKMEETECAVKNEESEDMDVEVEVEEKQGDLSTDAPKVRTYVQIIFLIYTSTSLHVYCGILGSSSTDNVPSPIIYDYRTAKIMNSHQI